jgi:hypothetical protein
MEIIVSNFFVLFLLGWSLRVAIDVLAART